PRRSGVPAHGRDRRHLEVQDREADVSPHRGRLRRARGLAMRAFLLVFASALASCGFAQEAYPSRPVRIIVPFSAGSVTDFMARSVSDKLSASLGQPVIVVNREGAGGTIGTDQVAKSLPDAYTLAVVSEARGKLVAHAARQDVGDAAG